MENIEFLKTLRPVKAVQDNDSHWYVIPNDLYDRFKEWNNLDSESEEFDWEEFDDYRTGGDLNLIQLFASDEK